VLIETAYRLAPELGLAQWNQDEAGPYQAIPQPGIHWCPSGAPLQYPHEYIRGGTAKLLTLFHPATGEVRVKGVESATNAVLHPWLKEQLEAILSALPPPRADLSAAEIRSQWERWQEGLTIRFTLLHELPPLRMLLVWDNLTGHHTAELLCWMMQRGIMPLYTPLGGSWLNMAESIQRILTRRALSGQHPKTPQEIIDWLEATAQAWNRDPTPFEWGGARCARRQRARHRHRLGGSGACTRKPLRHRSTVLQQWRRACQVTH
jgi:hypothetical protein